MSDTFYGYERAAREQARAEEREMHLRQMLARARRSEAIYPAGERLRHAAALLLRIVANGRNMILIHRERFRI